MKFLSSSKKLSLYENIFIKSIGFSGIKTGVTWFSKRVWIVSFNFIKTFNIFFNFFGLAKLEDKIEYNNLIESSFSVNKKKNSFLFKVFINKSHIHSYFNSSSVSDNSFIIWLIKDIFFSFKFCILLSSYVINLFTTSLIAFLFKWRINPFNILGFEKYIYLINISPLSENKWFIIR